MLKKDNVHQNHKYTLSNSDLSKIPFTRRVYNDILASNQSYNGKIWKEDQFWHNFIHLLTNYYKSTITNKLVFYDDYMYKIFGEKLYESHLFTLSFMISYQRYFSQTFECRVLCSFLNNSDTIISKQALQFYLKCRKNAEKLVSYYNQNLLSADNSFLFKHDMIAYLTDLLKDKMIAKRIWGWIKQEETFLREIHHYNLDNSGLAETLLKFFAEGGDKIGLSYIFEFLFKKYLINDCRLIQIQCKRLNIKNLDNFVYNINQFEELPQKTHDNVFFGQSFQNQANAPEEVYCQMFTESFARDGTLTRTAEFNFIERIKAKELCMETIMMKKSIKERKIAIGKQLGLIQNTEELRVNIVDRSMETRKTLQELRDRYNMDKFDSFDMPVFAIPRKKSDLKIEKTNEYEDESVDENKQEKVIYCDVESAYSPEILKSSKEVAEDYYSKTSPRKNKSIFINSPKSSKKAQQENKLNIVWSNQCKAFDNKDNFSKFDSKTFKKQIFDVQSKARSVFRNSQTIMNIYEKRMGEIRDILTKSIFLNRKMFNRKPWDIGMTIYSFNLEECCDKCGGAKENYLKRLKIPSKKPKTKTQNNSDKSYQQSDSNSPIRTNKTLSELSFGDDEGSDNNYEIDIEDKTNNSDDYLIRHENLLTSVSRTDDELVTVSIVDDEDTGTQFSGINTKLGGRSDGSTDRSIVRSEVSHKRKNSRAVDKIIEEIVEIPVEVIIPKITEVEVEIIKEVPVEEIVEIVREIEVESIIEVPKEIEVIKPIQKIVEVIVKKTIEIEKIVEKEKIVEVIIEIDDPYEVIKEIEIIKEIEEPYEVIKEVEVIKEIIVIKEVEIEVEEIIKKEIVTEKIVEKFVEVPYEVIVEVEVVKEIIVNGQDSSKSVSMRDVCLSPKSTSNKPFTYACGTQTDGHDPSQQTIHSSRSIGLIDKDIGLTVLTDLFNNLINEDKATVENWVKEKLQSQPEWTQNSRSKQNDDDIEWVNPNTSLVPDVSDFAPIRTRPKPIQPVPYQISSDQYSSYGEKTNNISEISSSSAQDTDTLQGITGISLTIDKMVNDTSPMMTITQESEIIYEKKKKPSQGVLIKPDLNIGKITLPTKPTGKTETGESQIKGFSRKKELPHFEDDGWKGVNLGRAPDVSDFGQPKKSPKKVIVVPSKLDLNKFAAVFGKKSPEVTPLRKVSVGKLVVRESPFANK